MGSDKRDKNLKPLSANRFAVPSLPGQNRDSVTKPFSQKSFTKKIIYPDFFSVSHNGSSSSNRVTMRFCSARGGRGMRYSFILTIVNVATVVPLELLRT